MRSKERELLQECYFYIDNKIDVSPKELLIRIEKLLTQPEQAEQELMSEQEISVGNQSSLAMTRLAFRQGVKFAENHHKIGSSQNRINKMSKALALRIANEIADQFTKGFCNDRMVDDFTDIIYKHIRETEQEPMSKERELLKRIADGNDVWCIGEIKELLAQPE